MANDSSLPPQDPDNPDNPLRPADEWQLDDDNVFDENSFEAPKAKPLDGDDDDALGLNDELPSSGPSTSFVGKIKYPPADPDDALADLPPVTPASPGSGWLDVPAPRATPAPKSKAPESSDIFGPMSALGESDVIRNLHEPTPSSSNIFDAPFAGSSRFENPQDGTEDVTEGLASALEPIEPSSDFFASDSELSLQTGSDATDMIEAVPMPASLSSDSGPDFNRTSVGDSSSNLFADSSDDDEISYGESGVNLMNPDRGPDSGVFVGAGSSIFGADLNDVNDAGRVDVDEIPMMASSDDPADAELFDPEPIENTSNIFERGSKGSGAKKPIRASDIDFRNASDTDDLTPPRKPIRASDVDFGDARGTDLFPPPDADGGQVDWSLPEQEEEDLLSAQMSIMPSELTSDLDVNDLLADAEDQSELPITTTASRKRQSLPVQTEVDPPRPSRTRPIERATPDRPRRGGAGRTIAAGFLGLVLGAGALGGAHFAGVLPVEPDNAKINELTGQLTYAKGNEGIATRAAEKSESERKVLAENLKTAKQDLTAARELGSKAERDRQQAVAARQQAEKDKPQLEKDKQKAIADLAIAKAALTEQTKQLTDALAKATDLDKELTVAKKAADEQATLAKAADEKAVAATKKATAADGALVDIVKELKANKLVDEKDDTAAVIAKLPDVLKKVTTAATSADATKAAAAVKLAMKSADDARAEATKAKADATLAQSKADKAALDAKTATTALTAAKDDAQKKLDEMARAALVAEARSKAAQDDLVTKLAAADRNAASQAQLVEQLRKQVSDARSGAIVPLSAPEVVAREQAEVTLGTGLDLYFANRFADAEKVFRATSTASPNDARVWYFLGLSQWMQGNRDVAATAFKRGAELETRGQPGIRSISAALERVQGPARQALAAYRP